MTDQLLSEIREDGVALLTLNRPEARNALTLEMRHGIADALDAYAPDARVRAVVITGSEKAFAAGADIKAMAGAGPMAMQRLGLHEIWGRVARFPKPVIAAVNGYALGGGCELAMHADIIVAGRGAKFGQPEVKLGIMPGAGGTQRLVRAVGKHRAMKLLMLGDMISAEEAAQWGLVSELVEDDQVLPRALEMAAAMAALSPTALAHIKEVVLAGADLPLEAALAMERRAFHMLFDTADQKEGMAAFLEKRPARFTGE